MSDGLEVVNGRKRLYASQNVDGGSTPAGTGGIVHLLSKLSEIRIHVLVLYALSSCQQLVPVNDA